MTTLPSPPIPQQKEHESHYHGHVLKDEFSWLRAENWQDVMRDPSVLDADIRAYLEAENSYAESTMADTSALQETLFSEMKGRIKEDDSSVPAPDGPYLYYTSFITGGQHARFCRKSGEDAPEQVLIDGNALAEGQAYYNIGGVSHSPNHRYIAYAYDDKGSEYYTVRIYDIEEDKLLDDVIENSNGGVVWANDSQTMFYTQLDENHRPKEVFRHKLGTPTQEDQSVYEEKDSGFFIGVGQTQSGRYILIAAHDHQTSEVHLIDADAPTAPLQCVTPRQEGHEYSVEHIDNRFIIHTNKDGAEDFKIMSAPLDNFAIENWTDIEPHRPGRLILDVIAFKHHMVRLEREHGLPQIIIRNWADNSEHAINFAEEAYSLGMSAGYEFDTTSLRFYYSSMTRPSETYDYDMARRDRVLRKTQQIPSGHDPAQYVTKRLMAKAHDGEDIPISLVMRADTKRDGTAPLLLYGYGSYGISIPASFSTNRLSLVDRGFIYAIAHIRGGKDKGYNWYKNGRAEKKTNSFKDFISCADHLIAENFTQKGRIVAHGGSAGGMLMGAVSNMAPELFAAIIAEVPFVDVLNTMLDDTLPLTPPEWPEWGNPIESKTAYETIASYSPYDNVRAQSYPHIIALAGLTDPRVTYWEPAKWIARLRGHKTNDATLLLKTNMDAGHAGASGRFDRLKEVALAYAFALKMTPNPYFEFHPHK